ncbi:GIN domain-containing protein [Burkholderia sp. BCC1993]|uniref:GIN domain-containing protein n=1 Tax=Burkholderia sp. BCC1993 TaxID=2817444 RepID=UPI002AAFD945|nr:DUF2807 domain-containing protein [Burkholderia sp. BCC1993]
MNADTTIKENRPIQPVRKIVVKGSVDVIIRRSDTPSMVVSSDTTEGVESVKTTIQGDKLIIENVGTNLLISGGTVRIGEPFTMVSRNGSVQIFHKGVGSAVIVSGDLVCGNNTVISGRNVIATAPRIVVTITLPQVANIKIKGSGDVQLIDIQQESLSLEISGSGDIAANGEVGTLYAEISGSGDIDTRELIADRADLSVTGSGDIKAMAREEADATVVGSGDIVIHGNPPVRRKRVVGSGRIKFR